MDDAVGPKTNDPSPPPGSTVSEDASPDPIEFPIRAAVQPRQLFWNIIYAVLCGGLGLWGAYDYFIEIPQREADFARFNEAQQEMELLTAASESRPLSDAERDAFVAAEAITKEFSEPPVQPAAYDRAVQMWLYIVGCGVLGTPFFLWNLVVLPRLARRWCLEADGSLETPDGRIAADEMQELEMGRWMAKSIATVVTTDARRIVLDDYKFRGMDRIIGALAQRFEPGKWTLEAKQIPAPEVVADAPVDEDAAAEAAESVEAGSDAER